MSEIMFYCGIVFSIFFMIATIVYFIKANILEAFKYYFKIQKSNKMKNNNNVLSFKKNIVNKDISKENEDETSIINIAENYATTLLDAEDSTQLLDINK